MKYLNKKKIIYLIILSGFIYSVFLGIINTNKNDNFRLLKNGNFDHSIIRTDVAQYWHEAHIIKKNLKSGENFFKAGSEYRNSYLFPRIIAFYYILIDEDIKDNNGSYKLENFKFGIPILNSIIFYLSLIFFSKKLNLVFFLENKVVYYIVFFLALEPTLTQYHASYWSESIYLSIILVIFGLLIDLNKKKFFNLLIGFLIGLSFLQRNVSMYLLIPIAIYYIYFFKKFFIGPLFSCCVGFLTVIFFLGYSNYIKTEKFSIVPSDHKDGPYYLLAHQLNNETSEEKYKKRDIWIKENNLNITNKTDKNKIFEYQNQYFKESLKNNLKRFIFIHLKKSTEAQILNPFFVNNAYKTDKSFDRYWEKNFYLYKYKITYSLIIYFICFIGFIKMFNKINQRLLVLIFVFLFYYTGILGWVGWNRYMVPNLVFISIFFGVGLNSVIENIKNIKK